MDTMSTIDWIRTVKEWKPSKGSTRVREEKEIEEISESFKKCEHLGETGMRITKETEGHIFSDHISRYMIFRQLSEQLKKHKCVYKTNMKELSYELPFDLEFKNQLKYAKILYKKGFKNPEEVLLFYHEDRKGNRRYDNE